MTDGNKICVNCGRPYWGGLNNCPACNSTNIIHPPTEPTDAEIARTIRVEEHEFRRFRAACFAMQGLIVNSAGSLISVGVAKKALKFADALLEELDKE